MNRSHRSYNMSPVVVLDAEQRSALAVVRSLGRRGISVITASHVEKPLASASRYSQRCIQVPSPTWQLQELQARLLQVCEIGQVWPVTDTSATLIAQTDLPESAVIATAPRAQYLFVSRKDYLFDLADRCGVPVPTRRIAVTAADVSMAAADIGFPLVLKPSASKVMIGRGIASTNVQIVNSERELAEAFSTMEWLSEIPCIVQRWVPGSGVGICALRWNGRVLAWFSHRRVREKPPAGGVSVLSESIEVDEQLRLYAAKLLDELDWQGVAMIEFRRELCGRPWLMEINGRFWGSLQLAIDSGVDFPWMYYQCLAGDPPNAVAKYDVGRQLRWMLGDVDSLLLSLRRGCMAPQTRARLIRQFMSTFFRGNARNEVFRTNDPWPAARELRNWFSLRS